MTSPWEEGSLSARIALVGEAPSATEVALGRPFVGPSGKLLDEMLREAGIPRQSCYITNVFQEQVEKREDGSCILNGELLYSPKKGFTERGLEEAGPCANRLSRSGANCIVPLGNTALAYLFGDSRIGKWRGSIVESTRLPGRKLVGTYHPAFLLRGNLLYKYLDIHDLKRAREEASFPGVHLPERTLHIDPSYQDVVAYLDSAMRCPQVATDIEVLNRQVSCLSVATSPLDCMCIPMLDQRGRNRWSEEDECTIWGLYARLMGAENIRKINQNILFDMGFLLRQNNIFVRGPLGDTMIAQHIMYPDFPKGLDFLCSIRTKQPYYKDDGKLWSKPWVDMERFWRYNALDSAIAYECWEDMQAELADGYLDTYNSTMAMFPALLYMMTHGIRINTGRLAEQKIEAAAEIARLEAELAECSEWPFNPQSPKQCLEYFYITKGIKPYLDTKTGQPTSNDKAMARIHRRYGLREAKLVQEIRAIKKMASTYLEVVYDETERLMCSYNPRGTTTGRLSSSETIFGEGMNFQNLPTAFKDFLEADPL